MDRIIRLPELLRITGLSTATLYRKMASGSFPKAVILGPNARGWRTSAIAEWLESLEPVGASPESEED